MSHLQKLKKLLDSRWVSLNPSNHFTSSRTVLYLSSSRSHILQSHILQNCRFSSKRKANDLGEKSQVPTYVKEAQSAMLDYFHSTRSLQFRDAEHMSKNSPLFLENLLSRMDNKVDIGRSLTRFLRFHPINEFEPLFESMGLKPKEYYPYLPRQIIFLNDDPVFMNNYHVLCDYGIGRGKMGRIYMEAREVFRYDEGVLQSKLMSIGEVGLNQSMVTKLVISCPNVLIESAYKDFLELVNKLRGIGIAYDWIEPCILKEHSSKWHNMLGLVCLLRNMGCSEEQLQFLIRMHPELLCENSALTTFSIISLLTKFGCTSEGICTMLLQFPRIPVSRFLANLRSCYGFLLAIEMHPPDIGDIVSSHTLLLGSCPVKKYRSVMNHLCAGNKKTRELIKENPEVLKSWVYGKKIEPVSNEDELKSYNMKVKFLVDLGFVENSKEFDRAFKMFRGRGMELQERFDCFVQAGLNPSDVKRIVKSRPQILNQSKDSITTKIDFLVNDMGYPVSSLLVFPSYISYTVQRVKLRLSLYNWLKEEGVVDGELALSTIVTYSDARFMKTYVNCHPKLLKSWVYGTNIERVSNEVELKSYNMKVKFLLDLGFVENSKEFHRAIMIFRGRGMELQERFDCFVQAGLNAEDVKRMVKSCPQILDQSKDCITTKIGFLVNDMGYPLSSLLKFPAYISYAMQRVKLRLSMYNWLKEEGVVDGKLSLCTIVASSDARFMKTYVNSHPKGLEFWGNLKKQVYPD